jgi:hypothetical protein
VGKRSRGGCSTGSALQRRDDLARLKYYPDEPRRRFATVLRDLTAVVLIAFFAFAGWEAYRAVEGLTVISSSVVRAGTSVEDSFEGAAGAVEILPFVGEGLADALRRSGRGTGGELVVLGEEGEARIERLALVLSLLVFVLPTLLLIVVMLPRRLGQVRQLTAASVLLSGEQDPERRRLLAMRAAFALPYATLLGYTDDPLGDLVAGRYEPLIDAVLDEAGLVRGSARGPDPG